MTEGAATSRRRRAWRFGRAAEAVCANVLRLKGYRILAKDVRTPVGEIDIVARWGRVLAFIEVKARRSADGNDVIGPRQKRRILRAAEAFMSRRPALANLDVRFDVMLVTNWALPTHVPDVWRAGEQ